MKKVILFVVALFYFQLFYAQLVEEYGNPQRFQYSLYSYHQRAEPAMFGQGCANMPGTEFMQPYFLRRYKRNRMSNTIYGVAIPIYHYNHLYTQIDPEIRFRHLVNYYDTSSLNRVVVANQMPESTDMCSVLATAHIRVGNNALIGNYFKLPDDDSLWNTAASTYLPVIEVYFDQPQNVSDIFFVGINTPPIQFYFNTQESFLMSCILWMDRTDSVLDKPFYGVDLNDGSLQTLDFMYGVTWIDSLSWGAPFPIVTPPPCMPPIWLEVAEQHRQSATIQWRAQYSNSYFEVEYGPHGFAEGTGTTVGPVAPDAQYNGQVTLNGLTMDADYTVRVRSYCTTAGGYSDWTELDFHTDAFYNVNTSVNNESWGFVVGGGEYLSGATARLFAYPKSEYCPFLNWSDGSNQNPRVLTVTCDTSFLAIFGCDSVGINTVDGLAAVTVSPNPAIAEAVVRSSQPIVACTLYDIQGRAVASGRPGGTTATIDLRRLPPALYIVAVRTAAGTTVSKIIKN